MFRATCDYLKQRAHDPAAAFIGIRIVPEVPVGAGTASGTDYILPDYIPVMIKSSISEINMDKTK